MMKLLEQLAYENKIWSSFLLAEILKEMQRDKSKRGAYNISVLYNFHKMLFILFCNTLRDTKNTFHLFYILVFSFYL